MVGTVATDHKIMSSNTLFILLTLFYFSIFFFKYFLLILTLHQVSTKTEASIDYILVNAI